MCHGQIKSSKNIRFKKEDGRHANAQPYKRAEKHKSRIEDYSMDNLPTGQRISLDSYLHDIWDAWVIVDMSKAPV